MPLVLLPIEPEGQPPDESVPPFTPVVFTLHGSPVGRTATDRTASRARELRRRFLLAGGLDAVVPVLSRWAAREPAPSVTSLLHMGPTSPRSPSAPSLTAAVCTRDRPHGLAGTLESLRSQPAIDDIVVVDNAPSSDAARDVVQRYAGVRYVRETSPGLDHARNCALATSTADVVAFLDDDAQALPQWAARIQGAFARNPDLTLLFGLVEPAHLDSEGARLFEQYHGFARGNVPRWVSVPQADRRAIAVPHANTGALGTGACMAVRRISAQTLGGFDPALDAGTASAGGGDLAFAFRVLKAAQLLTFEPTVLAAHDHRATRRAVVEQLRSWGTGMSAHLHRLGRAWPEERPFALLLKLWLTATWHLPRLARAATRDWVPLSVAAAEVCGLWQRIPDVTKGAPAPGRPKTGSAADQRSSAASIDLAQPVDALTASSSHVHITPRRGPHAGARFTLPLINGWCGVDRVLDTIAAQQPSLALGVPLSEAKRQVRRVLLPAVA